MGIREEAYFLVRQIPRGSVSTYGEVARALGNRKAARAVGMLMRSNPDPVEMPCHRVVRSNGEVGGYNQGIERKIRLLRSEGVGIVDGRVVDFRRVLFTGFR
ncbi:MAG: MGMT family protein [Candidatus Altiarchaeota archaeon]